MPSPPLPLRRMQPNPCFVVRGDASGPSHARQWFERAGRGDGTPESWLYTDRLSYAPGETVRVHAISTAARVTLEVLRDGAQAVTALRLGGVETRWADTPEDASASGCGWPAVAAFVVGADWPSGAYRLILRAEGADAATVGAEHLFIVRPQPGPRPERLLLVVSDATWVAYNDWGGSNAYEGVIEPDTARFSPRLSIHRPFARGLLSLPPDAPRALPERPPPQGAPTAYPHMDWAWANGFSKKYASAGWASYERPFALWAEREGYALDVATQRDLHFRPEILDGAACVAFVGHDEYWTWEMRDAVDAYVARGGRVARFAGNFFWQIRLEDDGATQICHKYRAEAEDPVCGTADARRTTTLWDSPVVDRPGHETFGLDGSRGVYAGWGGTAPRGAGGFTLYRPEHWAFEGCGLGYGDVLGAESRIFGYEVDGLDHRIVDGLPFPEPQPVLPEDLEILALGLARAREDVFAPTGAPLFVGDDDARLLARLRFGADDPEAVARANRGSGMIVSFTRDAGAVFHAGATEWVAGLLRRDPGVMRVTKNVLTRFIV